MNQKQKDQPVWQDIQQHDRYVAISELIRDSQPNSIYYSLLVLSSIIIASGVLLANSAILIGGMLVTPVLTPILLLSLAIVTSRPIVIKRTSKLIAKSVGLIFAISFMAGLIFGVPEDKEFFNHAIFNNSLQAAFLYFLVAFASGVAATFAWIRKEVSNILPGISIAVSLVPPISLIGVWLAQNEIQLARYFLLIFLFNMIGIIMSSMIVFSLLNFYKSGDNLKINSDQDDILK
ncbi:MAG TPA: DUF389 domain-containing protein [Candidatus Paceibacterota bacterium]|nr:DUF389 domain-containing protein [Candidatus Paceibacterota bacterium]HMP18905.1 DUF389 domain-containing protein [Candidatus Paceibacterota bacterium]HMP85066.1 DUF389 domain-containing protein [Candidatus Paceibacterota bacterium]